MRFALAACADPVGLGWYWRAGCRVAGGVASRALGFAGLAPCSDGLVIASVTAAEMHAASITARIAAPHDGPPPRPASARSLRAPGAPAPRCPRADRCLAGRRRTVLSSSPAPDRPAAGVRCGLSQPRSSVIAAAGGCSCALVSSLWSLFSLIWVIDSENTKTTDEFRRAPQRTVSGESRAQFSPGRCQ